MKAFSSILVLILASSVSAIISYGTSYQSIDQCFPDDIPWYTYEGQDFIFTRMKVNSLCTDDRGKQYEWGKIGGVYPPIDEPNGGCSKICVSGHPSYEARGCTGWPTSQLVGFNYNCNENACYCLYEKDTLGSRYKNCFDDMNTSNKGKGSVAGSTAQQGSTCYSLDVQPAPSPTPPGPAPGSSICTYAPDYECYQTGWPACCSVNDGASCPDYMTICDNFPSGSAGTSYCTYSPDYTCYETGWPACCDMPGGDIMNCPIDKPPCDTGLGMDEEEFVSAERLLRDDN